VLKRLSLTFLAGAVAVTALTGCVPQSRDSLDRYVEALDAVPGVDVDYYGVSTPLPFSVQGTVDLSFDADAATLSALEEAGCAGEVNASVSLSLTARAGATAARLERVGLCDGLLVDLVGLARATESFGVELVVDDVADTDVWVGAADDISEELAVLRVASDFAPSGTTRFGGEVVRLEAADLALAQQYLDDFAALVAAFGVAELELADESLVIQALTASDGDAIEDFLTARDASRYSGLTIVVTDAASGDVPAGTDAVTIALRDRIVAELGLSVNIGGNTVYVKAADGDEVVQIAEQIAELNTDEVRVGITIAGDEDAGIPQFRTGDDPELTPSFNPYPMWVDQFDRLVATGLVGTVEVGPGSLSVWLFEDVYDDADAVAKVRKVLDALAAEYDLSRWELNNRDLTEA
jgi:hypothetical protein